MFVNININEFFSLSRDIPVVDVRSPGEYKKGHIPGSINIPLFDDEERAKVGTLYKQTGKNAAVLEGLEIAGKKMRSMAEAALKTAVNKKLIVHCWRGGMRSASMAWLFESCGISCYILTGGYKTYRSYARSFFSTPFKYIVIGGMTGSGKSAILDELEKNSYQVLKLEEIANHKGSAFGMLGEKPQNENEQFENDVFTSLFQFDENKAVFVEDESRNIGRNIVPPELFEKMTEASLLVIEMPREIRVKRLVNDYGVFSKEELKECVLKIAKRLGGDNTRKALESLDEGLPEIAADISLNYYDKTYGYGLSVKKNKEIIRLPVETADAKINSREILRVLHRNGIL
ncbi:MAG: tRNA 2-selenouridine(34) synthase MnmH [Bacteroidales bacterium]|nr:tRNA 2-selenouridine(34) synthase MnmH [Bacteroidales bacterium]MCB9000113.1 tRNA 2-selenouridine(34) synthase MnmH [Bacteroidales bacterium]